MFVVPFPLFVVTYDLREILFMDVSSETYVFLQILFREIHYKILKITWGSNFSAGKKKVSIHVMAGTVSYRTGTVKC